MNRDEELRYWVGQVFYALHNLEAVLDAEGGQQPKESAPDLSEALVRPLPSLDAPDNSSYIQTRVLPKDAA